MQVPSSTYRLQFNKEFTFRQFESIIPYLNDLGITTVYAAPVSKSTPGSMHGYDVIDPHAIDPEIGTEEEFRRIAQTLRQYNMHWLQDIVPNHMAFSPVNARLMDVLERGDCSPYYRYFDINWKHPSPALRGKVMVPFLGDTLEQCVSRKEVQLNFSAKGFTVNYFDNDYPLSIPAVKQIATWLEGEVANDIKRFAEQAASADFKTWRNFRKQWCREVTDSEKSASINKRLASINEDGARLMDLLERQHYVLTYWKRTEWEINYRRFFTVNSLICLRMEDEEVFSEYHTFLLRLYQEELIHGLRIDHIDGLNDPTAYITKLREWFGDDCYIIAEKILEANEQLPETWALQGTSGYEFLSHVSQLFTDKRGARKLKQFYRELIPDMPSYEPLVLANKRLILEKHMAGEWENLVHYFFDLGLQQHFTHPQVKNALAAFMVSLPVYRIYPDTLPLRGISHTVLQETFKKAATLVDEGAEALKHMEVLFTQAPADSDQGKYILLFLKRLMQFTGPLTAKGVEDTTFYVYNPLISHDEVGDAPSTLGISVQEFHQKMQLRMERTPLSLNTTATHDTKRGEDARLRLNCLSELPELWQQHVQAWFRMNEAYHKQLGEKKAPVKNDEYFIYQSIIGGFPEDQEITEEWIKRLEEYLIKVVREAKINSSWENPDEEYEAACLQFVNAILDNKSEFVKDLLSFYHVINAYAQIYTLGQTLVKITAPGIPDTYQGCELWDLSFVDPDNRRPVDFSKRISYLQHIKNKEKQGTASLLRYLGEHRAEGVEKLYITYKALNFRRRYSELFNSGKYLPLQVSGADTTALAYARVHRDKWIIVVIPLDLKKHEDEAVTREAFLILPPGTPVEWIHEFTGEKLDLTNGISIALLFLKFPVALLHNNT